MLERKAFDKVVSELVEEFDLDSVADRILVERTAMYLIRIARAEAYESAVGVSEKSVLWGAYISRLDNTLRGLLNDLAVTRLRRKRLDKDEALLVSVDDVLKKFAEKEATLRKGERVSKRRAALVPREALLRSWRRECTRLRLSGRRARSVGEEE
ncbi:MAG: hypothetical protein OEY22_10155 [Candidatus Bathyarchaeota archaeon]|nr:hypothetical protein [Candidatus Bathyarchaeota archaeon]